MDPACRAAETQRLCDVAAASVRPQGAPAAGAVCFSSRWKHPASTKDPYDTFQVAAAFHATDFVWVYSLDKQFVQRMKQSAAKVCLAVNSMVPDAVGTNTRRRGRLLDLDGNLLLARDPYRGVRCVAGRLLLPQEAGIGAEPAGS